MSIWLFNIGNGTNGNSLREHFPLESELTLSKVISAGYTVKKTRKHPCEILTSNEIIDLHKISKHWKYRCQTSSQATDIVKKWKFCENFLHLGKCPAYG